MDELNFYFHFITSDILFWEYYTTIFPLLIIMTDSYQKGPWGVTSCHDYDDGDYDNGDDAKMIMAICDDGANLAHQPDPSDFRGCDIYS